MEDIGRNVKVKTANNKIVEYRQQGNAAMQLLVRSQTPELKIDLADLMKYPLTPVHVPFSIGTTDSCFAKTDKSKGLKYLLSKFSVGLKTLLHQGLSEPEFYGDLVYKFKKIVGRADFSDQFKKNYRSLQTYWI